MISPVDRMCLSPSLYLFVQFVSPVLNPEDAESDNNMLLSGKKFLRDVVAAIESLGTTCKEEPGLPMGGFLNSYSIDEHVI